MRSPLRLGVPASAAILAVVAATFLTSCGTTGDQSSGQVTITVGDRPSEEQAEDRALFDDRVAAFEEAHPNITIEAVDTAWNPQTYQAMIAGGTMPTTLRVPLTEIQSLAERGQVADITDAVAADPVASTLNPVLVEQATRDGRVYGLPTGGYSMAFVYSRALYAEAGLDPDSPPTTWDEVLENAAALKAIGATGYVQATKDNGGGWMLTALSYGFGGQLEEVDGESATATLDNEGTRAALQFLSDVRWQEDAFGANFLLGTPDIANGLAAGEIGQAMMPGDTFGWFAGLGMPVEDIGVAPLPQQADGIGTLAGGNISVVNPDATPEEAAAAITWINFRYLEKYTDEEAARADAQAQVDQGFVVGAPEIPLFDNAAQDVYLGYIDDLINVPRENFQSYIDSFDTLPLVPEPKVAAQQIYALLDATVQAVLTDQAADLDALLADAQTQAEGLIAAAQ